MSLSTQMSETPTAGWAGREEEDGAGTPFFMLVVYSSPSSRGREGEVARQ